MTQPNIAGISTTLQTAYDEQYSDRMTEWRELGGKYKAENILAVCAGHAFRRVLECGAGEGSILKHLDASGAFDELHALEISDSGIAQIRKRALPRLRELKKFDGYQVPYPDRSFDLVYCSHVLEHVEHPRVLLRELRRVSGFQAFEVPLDYAPGIDRNVGALLSYGHINVFTPSTFKFLLRSEGYEILAERRTRQTNDVIRFNWYRNQGLERTFRRERKLLMRPLREAWRRIRKGRAWEDEFGFSAYTCLARSAGELRIMGTPAPRP